MTAFEMADLLSKYEKVAFDNLKVADVITMLRIQAHEIKALMEQLNEAQL